MELSHKVGGWVWDITRKQYSKIVEIRNLAHDDKQWLDHGAPNEPMYALVFQDWSFTHYLCVDELSYLYAYIGTNVAAIEVLYGT